MDQVVVGAEVWVPSKETVWEVATVLARTGSLATLRTAGNEVLQMDLSTTPAFLLNPSLASDMTSLYHIHEPGILYNLEQRSGKNEAYTLMGSVLVAVNPLVPLPDPPGILGQKKAASIPHPYGTAEVAYSQMVFSDSRKEQEKDTIVNQSVVISGESGAGKTESSKMVLKHLVHRNNSIQNSNLDQKLLGSNPILEAFGNASTLRNHNSSRFGKFFKLHFSNTKKKGEPTVWNIAGATAVTYLLERSRIVSHNNGERGYHIFYQLGSGAPKTLTSSLGLNIVQNRYMTPSGSTAVPPSATKLKMDDAKDFVELDAACGKIGLSPAEKEELYKVVAGIVHLGNLEFTDEERPEGDCAIITKGNATYSSLQWVCKMFGLREEALTSMLVEYEVKLNNEKVIRKRNSQAAAYARDAVAKGTYSRLFDWIVMRVNQSLLVTSGSGGVETMPFIGVLDIFGFESFERNDFEQLLINYTNEALQATFNRQVFIAEAELYKREGLVIADGQMAKPPDNTECMILLSGVPKPKLAPGAKPAIGGAGAGNQNSMGLLKLIDAETQSPQANDDKMNRNLHKVFEKNPFFMKPHPKDKATTFIVRHYAGAVVYTVGMFVEKNVDNMPKEVSSVMSGSSVSILKSMYENEKKEKMNAVFGGSIVGKFEDQINKLIDTLEATRCTFVRCVKPNPKMVRTQDLSWFDRRYVTQQLKCLSIPQTAEVLKTGLPTRMPYDALTEQYQKVLPAEAIALWKKLGKGENQGFMRALFWAFEVPANSYRCGLTKVFFGSGELSQLENILEASSKWSSDPSSQKEKEKVVKRFKLFYIRSKWRKAIAVVMANNKWIKLLNFTRTKAGSAAKVQALFRMKKEKAKLNRSKQGALMAQKLYRARLARKVVERKRAEALAEAKRRAEEARKAEEAARKKAEEERLRIEEERRKAEEERKRAEEERKRAEEERKRAEEEMKKHRAAAAAAAEEADRRAAEAELLRLEQEESKRAKEEAEREAMERKRAEEEAIRAAEVKKMEEEQLKLQKAREEAEQAHAREEKEAERAKAEEAAEIAAVKAEYSKMEDSSVPESMSSDVSMQQRKTGASTAAPGKARRKSTVRAVTAADVGPSAVAQLQAKAQELRKADESKWNTHFVGFLNKRSKSFPNGWKKRFFSLDRKNQSLSYWQKANDAGTKGEGKSRGIFMITPKLIYQKAEKDKKPFVIYLKDENGKEIHVGCISEQEREEWLSNIAQTIAGFTPSPQTLKAEEDYRAAEKSAHENEQAKSSSSAAAAASSSQDTFDESKIDYSRLPADVIAQLEKIESLVEAGVLSEQEGKDLRPHILSGYQENITSSTSAPEPVNAPAFINYMDYYQTPGMELQIVACTTCNIVNTHGGATCVFCGAQLPYMNADYEAQQYANEDCLCVVPYKNGTFRCYYLNAETTLDSATWTQQLTYIYACEWTRPSGVIERWNARHNWFWIQHEFIQFLTKDGVKFQPLVDPAEGKKKFIPQREKALDDFLRALFKENSKIGEKLLHTRAIDMFFKLSENCLEERNMDEYAQHYVLQYQQASGREHAPLTLEEMEVAQYAAEALTICIRGDEQTRAVDIHDPVVREYERVCRLLLPRLEISKDPSNPNNDKALIGKAWEVEEIMTRALRLHDDTIAVLNESLYLQ